MTKKILKALSNIYNVEVSYLEAIKDTKNVSYRFKLSNTKTSALRTNKVSFISAYKIYDNDNNYIATITREDFDNIVKNSNKKFKFDSAYSQVLSMLHDDTLLSYEEDKDILRVYTTDGAIKEQVISYPRKEKRK